LEGRSKKRSAVLLSLALGAALSATVALAGTARQAVAASSERMVFSSNRTTGTGVNNPTGDYEIFRMNHDGTGVRQLTFNKGADYAPDLSPDGKKIVYTSRSVQVSNPDGDYEVYVMNTVDGSGKRNLTNNGADIHDYYPHYSPGGKRIAYTSYGIQRSNPEGDSEVYVVNALDGTGKKNLTNNGVEVNGAAPVDDYDPIFSPGGKRIAYQSAGNQASNPEGDSEVYGMSALDGTGKKNLTNTDLEVVDFSPTFSPDSTRIAYTSFGKQTSNLEGDYEIYAMNASDGSGQANLSNSGADVFDHSPTFSPGGKRIAYTSFGIQPSNPEGDFEVYRTKALDGSGQMNLTDNAVEVDDSRPRFSSDGTRVFYESEGIQTSNPEGDHEMYRMNAADGWGKRNLTDNKVAFDGHYAPIQM